MRYSKETIAAWLLIIGILVSVYVIKQPDIPMDFGYSPDPIGAEAFAAGLPSPTFSQAAPDAMKKVKPEDTFLWRAMDSAHRARYGTPFKVSHQGSVGSCVAHGAAHAIFASESIAWSLGERSDPPEWANQASIYGGSRVEIRGNKTENRGGDGSTGYHAAKWLSEYGVIYQRPYPSVDCTDASPSRCKDWGRYGNGGKGNVELDETAKKTPARYVTRVSNWEELVAAICTGNAVTIASNQGFSKTAKDSWLRPSGVWMHQMAIVGIKVTGRQGACIINSWGENWIRYEGEIYPPDLPPGCFWADRSVIERILSQGDSWAISEIAFKFRDIHHNNWLEEQ